MKKERERERNRLMALAEDVEDMPSRIRSLVAKVEEPFEVLLRISKETRKDQQKALFLEFLSHLDNDERKGLREGIFCMMQEGLHVEDGVAYVECEKIVPPKEEEKEKEITNYASLSAEREVFLHTYGKNQLKSVPAWAFEKNASFVNANKSTFFSAFRFLCYTLSVHGVHPREKEEYDDALERQMDRMIQFIQSMKQRDHFLTDFRETLRLFEINSHPGYVLSAWKKELEKRDPRDFVINLGRDGFFPSLWNNVKKEEALKELFYRYGLPSA